MANFCERIPLLRSVLKRFPRFGSKNNYLSRTNLIDEKDTPIDIERNIAVLQATVLLEDAIHFRSIFHKMDKIPLIVYRCYYTGIVQKILYMNIFIIL